MEPSKLTSSFESSLMHADRLDRHKDEVIAASSKNKQRIDASEEDEYEQDFEDSGPQHQVDDYSEDDDHVNEGLFTAEEMLTRAQIRNLIG